ncbi:V-type proton ATPase subunit C-like [Argiope bruennichi]|uniref:V-type proton ATPase subunit C n=1 Tax=Argiope bruennichi TaxID=94029 RepID=A0A8T0FDH7_ARGBR|nr:V-type proton ATPase subunit C-like [Argiope bruennichi]XP_055925666.1 V-type proton ATPase subunit C-like [Argiope bruennichi]XP_055925668.1 V-type proton ATPase subunit C-like [Argiope bruennichi]KAF8789176.1 V-type proton ATPase subunit C like protein [Argiope bruennichi]
MPEFWVVSAPGPQALEKLNAVTKPNNLSVNYKFHIPDLKVGTLDTLVGLTDDLAKLDTYVEGIIRKLVNYMEEILEDQKEMLHENLHVNNADVPQYLTRFQWDMAKYPARQPLPAIAEIINKQVQQIEADLKQKASAYNSLKTSLQNLERKQTGSLLLRSLGDLVKKEHFVLDSEYLTTLLVVVPNNLCKEWEKSYENITDFIVPRSSQKLYADNEHTLYNITLFKKVAEEFKNKAREKKFVVRDFTYSEEQLAAGKSHHAKLKMDKSRQLSVLFRWLKINFSECFVAFIHVKALRVFVESVLRYGLPVNFQAMLLQPAKNTKKLREVLNKLYSHLDSSLAAGSIDDVPGGLASFGVEEYYPYVYFKINVDMCEKA